MKRKILSVITALALCLSLCPAGAFAAEMDRGADPPQDLNAETAGGTPAVLAALGHAAREPDDEASVTTSKGTSYFSFIEDAWAAAREAGNATVTLLNNAEVTERDCVVTTIYGSVVQLFCGLGVGEGEAITLTSEDKDYTLTFNLPEVGEDEEEMGFNYALLCLNGTLTIDGCTIEAGNAETAVYGIAMAETDGVNDCQVTIEDSAIHSACYTGVSMEVETGDAALSITDSEIAITGTNVVAVYIAHAEGEPTSNRIAEVTIEDSEITVEGTGSVCGVYAEDTDITIKGTTIEARSEARPDAWLDACGVSVDVCKTNIEDSKITAEGGFASGVEITDGTTAIKGSETAITATAPADAEESYALAVKMFGGEHTIEAGEFTATSKAESTGVYADDGATLNISGGKFTATSKADSTGVYVYDGAMLNISGGKFTGTCTATDEEAEGYGLFVDPPCEVSLSGGEFSGTLAAVAIVNYWADTAKKPVDLLDRKSTETGHYTYFDGGAPIEGAWDLDSLTDYKSVTVEECSWKYESHGDGMHTETCDCGYRSRSEYCEYGEEYGSDADGHWLPCKYCGYKNVEGHKFQPDGFSEGNVRINYKVCEDCEYQIEVAKVTVIVPDGLTYGATAGKEVTCVIDPDLVISDVSWELTTDEGNWVSTATDLPANQPFNLPADLPAGDYAIWFGCMPENEIYRIYGSNFFTVDPAPLTEGMVALSPASAVYNGAAQKPAVSIAGLTEGTDYDAAYSSEDFTNAGTITVTVTGKGNYSGTIEKEFTIGKATLTADGTGIASGTYGDTLAGLTVGGLTAMWDGTPVAGSWALAGETIPDVDDSGRYTAVFTPDSDARNYEALTAQVTLSIAKADHADADASTSCKYGLARTYDMAGLLPKGYVLGTVSVSDGDGIFDGTPTVNGTVVAYKLASDAGIIGKTGVITVPVTSAANYNGFDVIITVTAADKDIPDLSAAPIQVTYTGSPVPDSSISGTATVDGQAVSGKWSFVSGQELTNVADSGTKQVTFTPDDTDLYQADTISVTVTISKATPSLALTPSPAVLPHGGMVTLTLSGLPEGGEAVVACDDESISVTAGAGNVWTAELPAGGAAYSFTASYAGDGNHNGAEAVCTVSVEKITPELALTAVPDSLLGGGTVTLTLTGLPDGETAAVTCSGGISVTAGLDGTWTATLPNTTAAYTFTASYGGNDSYNAASTSCTVTVKEVVSLPDPPADDDDTKFQLVMETGISEVPEGLKDVEGLETPEKLVIAMKTAITEANSGVSQANIAVYDVELMVSTDGGSTWTPATKANFPSGGLVITLPYPDGTNSSYKFTVVHMFTSGDFGHNPGETETPVATNTADGIRFTVTGLSPISVGWEQASTPSTPAGPSTGNPGSGGGGSYVSTYAVTVEKSEHGKVTSNRTSAANNSTVTLTVTPDSGYVLDTLTVTDSRGNEIKLTAQGGGKYTFTMPGRAVTVKAAFVPLPEDVEQICDGGAACPSHGFTDLGTVGTWYHEAVDYVLRNGLMNGYSSSLFGPDDNLSRAQLAQILYNKEGKPPVTGGSIFTDVADGQWYAPAITWAAANGIVNGYGNGLFGPDDNITREQLAVMLWRYAGSPAATNKELHFTDADEAGDWALEALRWAVENGILNGYGDGQLDPGRLATRAQVAQMLKNFMNR